MATTDLPGKGEAAELPADTEGPAGPGARPEHPDEDAASEATDPEMPELVPAPWPEDRRTLDYREIHNTANSATNKTLVQTLVDSGLSEEDAIAAIKQSQNRTMEDVDE